MKGAKRYPWFFFDASRPWRTSLVATLAILSLSLISFFVYSRFSHDLSPDSIAGYIYASGGTLFMLLALFLFMLARRSRKHKRTVGKLNVALHWHISFGVIALVLLFLHSFGNFNRPSGSLALFGMIALVISGFVGRMLDRFMPRMIAREVNKALTPQGEDRIEEITRTLQAIVDHSKQEIRAFKPQDAASRPTDSRMQPTSSRAAARSQAGLPTSWDLAYISLDETPQELARDNPGYRFVPDRRSSLTEPGALMPGLQEHMLELHSLQRSQQREQFFRAIIRYWRVFHISLMLLTVGLTLWHLEYAASLLFPMWFGAK